MQWLVIILITKAIGVEELGVYALGMALVNPIFMFASLSLRSLQATDIKVNYPFSSYFAFRVTTSIFATLACFGLVKFLNYEDQTTTVILLLVVLKIIESIADVYFGDAQQKEKMELIGRSLIYRSALALLLATVAIISFQDIRFCVVAMILAYFINFWAYDFRVSAAKVSIRRVFSSGRYLKDNLHFFMVALPLGVTVSINILYQSVPRFLVDHFHGSFELGVFAATSYFLVVGSTVVNAIGQAAVPRLARYYLENRHAFVVLMRKILAISAAIGMAGVVFAAIFSDAFLSLIYSEDFLGKQEIFVGIMVMSIFVYISGILGCALTSMKAFSIQAYISIFCSVLLCLLSYYWIQERAALGAVIAMGLTYALKAVLEFCSVLFYFQENRKPPNTAITS